MPYIIVKSSEADSWIGEAEYEKEHGLEGPENLYRCTVHFVVYLNNTPTNEHI